uniref:Nucleolar protein 16 n=1 Tax=Strongyloides papillosus TaxID=174720 RepID=A0A0N5B5F9_STREA
MKEDDDSDNDIEEIENNVQLDLVKKIMLPYITEEDVLNKMLNFEIKKNFNADLAAAKELLLTKEQEDHLKYYSQGLCHVMNSFLYNVYTTRIPQKVRLRKFAVNAYLKLVKNLWGLPVFDFNVKKFGQVYRQRQSRAKRNIVKKTPEKMPPSPFLNPLIYIEKIKTARKFCYKVFSNQSMNSFIRKNYENMYFYLSTTMKNIDIMPQTLQKREIISINKVSSGIDKIKEMFISENHTQE